MHISNICKNKQQGTNTLTQNYNVRSLYIVMHSKHAKRQNIFSSSLYSEGNSRAEVQHNSEIAYRHIQSQIIASRSEFRTLSKDEFILLKFLASYILFKSGKMDKMYNTRLSQAQGGSYVLDIRGGRPWALGVWVLNWEKLLL